jgi:hypothetical protein
MFSIAGRVSITLETFWYKPLDSNSSSDQQAAEQSLEFNVSCSELCKNSIGSLFPTIWLIYVPNLQTLNIHSEHWVSKNMWFNTLPATKNF